MNSEELFFPSNFAEHSTFVMKIRSKSRRRRLHHAEKVWACLHFLRQRKRCYHNSRKECLRRMSAADQKRIKAELCPKTDKTRKKRYDNHHTVFYSSEYLTSALSNQLIRTFSTFISDLIPSIDIFILLFPIFWYGKSSTARTDMLLSVPELSASLFY